jgi:putative nucleotidyltransferase with HDIG domain
MNENFDEFDKYVQQYDLNEKMIEYKYNHSYRVVHQAEEICRSLNLDTVERDLASNIALLHDIARFRQWTEYKTFNDRESFDHGEEGVKILFDEGEIENYIIDKDDYEVVKKAIYYHNKFDLNYDELTEREKIHCNIVRDADKVDILYAFSTNRLLELTEDDSEINPKIKEDFFEHKETLNKEIISKNDRIVSMFALCFDLNYDYSKKRVYNEDYLGKMLASLKNKKLFKPYVDEVKKYLKGEIKNVR